MMVLGICQLNAIIRNKPERGIKGFVPMADETGFIVLAIVLLFLWNVLKKESSTAQEKERTATM